MSSPEAHRAAAIIVAAGAGRRMGGGARKQYLLLAGRPVLEHSVLAFLSSGRFSTVVVVLSHDDAAEPPEWLAQLEVTIVAGGPERGDSVWAGLAATPVDADPILIHDGARPFVSAAVIDRVLERALTGVGVVAAIPLADTIKVVDAGGRIISTPDRAALWLAQTPQGFPRQLILEAHRDARKAGLHASDDAALVERIGGEVHVVEGAAENLKITRRADLVVAEALASQFLTG